MIRVLVIIAVTGFLVSVVCLSAAIGIAGPDVIAGGEWPWNPAVGWIFDREDGGWRFHHHGFKHDEDGEDGAPTTRQLAWTGGSAVEVELPAEVQYTQADGPAKLVVSGPADAVADVEVDGDSIRFRHDRDHSANLKIVMTAPAVTRFEMSGSGKLAIAGYRQDKLALDLSGDADVEAKGEASSIDLTISGSGSANLAELKAKAADVSIEGSGDATIAPSEAAKIDVSGSGEVSLRSDPPKIETNVSGSGSVQRDAGARSTNAGAPASTSAKKRSGA
jgi:hypothetical protein